MKSRLERLLELDLPREWHLTAALLAAWTCVTAFSMLICGTGFIHPESCAFLPHYLSDRPLLEKLYDARVTELGLYAARELALLFDWIDCQFIGWSVAQGRPHFFSICHHGWMLLAGLLLARVCRALGSRRVEALGWTLLMWTGPSAMLHTSYFRNAKPALLCCALACLLVWLGSREKAASWLRTLLFGLLALLMPFCDKQGLVFLAGAVLFLGLFRQWRLLGAALAAFGIAYMYQGWIGPALVRHFNGYELDLSYASLGGTLRSALANPAQSIQSLLVTPLMALDSYRFVLGAMPVGIALASVVIVVSAQRNRRASALLWLWALGSWFLMQLVSPWLFSTEHRRFYYPLAFGAVWLPWVVTAVNQAAWRRWLPVLIAIALVSNVFALQDHRSFMRNGYFERWFRHAERWTMLVRPENIRAQGITPVEARELLPKSQAPVLPEVYPPPIREDRLFLFFLSRLEAAPKP
jgi:hypothetical protein